MPKLAHIVVATALALACLASTSAGVRAAPPGPGVYAVAWECEYWGVGKTKKAAIAACDRKVAHDRMPKSCRCSRGASVATFAKAAPKVAFYLAGASVGRTAAAARAACVKLYESHHTDDEGSCKDAMAAYGPFDFGVPVEDNPFVYLTDGGFFVDATGDSPCFPAGTLVATPDGDRPIESLKVGDAVLSWSVAEGRAVVARVSHAKVREADLVLALTLADGRTLRVTPNHPLWEPARAQWTLAGDVAVGDLLAVRDAAGALSPVAVTAVASDPAPSAGPTQVYDLTVLPTHAYFAGGVLAHNY